MSTKKKISLIVSCFVLLLVSIFVASATDDSGKISISKTATKSDDRTANVSLKVSANPLSDTPVDVVFVLDKSGSMSVYKIDGTPRIDVARDAALDLVDSLITEKTKDLVKIGIVSFGKNVKTADTSTALTNDKDALLTFVGNIKGGSWDETTNVQAGLAKARELLSGSSSTADRKVVILLSDGVPTKFNYKGYLCGDGTYDKIGANDNYVCKNSGYIPSTAANVEANALKKSNVEIYTIGFGSNVSEFEYFLKDMIATDTNHYYPAESAEALNTAMGSITSRIGAVVASNVKVEDIIPVGFHITEESKNALIEKYGEGNVVFTVNASGETVMTVTIGDLYANKGDYTIDYELEADPNHYGAMYTNKEATLTGKATTENQYYTEKNLELTFDKPVVNIEMVTVDDDYTDSPVENGDTLTITSNSGIIEKVNSDSLHDTLIKHEDIQIQDGEEVYDKVEVTDEIIYTNPTCGTVSVNNDGSFVYEADKDCAGEVTFEYYVKTTVTTTDKEGKTTTDILTSNTSTVKIKVVEAETSYKVRYLEEGTNNVLHAEKTSDGYVFDEVTENAISINGYEISGDDEKTITLVKDENANVITFYYKRVTAEVKDPVITKKGPESTITSTSTKVPYEITYTTQIDEYIGKATITITDQLEYPIDEANSNLDGGTYDSKTKRISWVEILDVDTYQNINNTIKITKNIEVSYIYPELDGTEDEIKNQVTGKTHVETAVDKEKTTTEYTDFDVRGNLFVHHIYVDKDGNEIDLVPEVKTNEKVGTSYTTSAREDITGYSVKTIPENKDGKYIEGDITVKYYYDKVPAEIKDPTLTKTGSDEITKVGDTVNYEIFHQFTIDSYKGNATITVVDTLPYHIDESKSNLSGGTYNDSEKTITWIITKENIDTFTTGEQKSNTKISFSVVYTDMDASANSMNNHAKATVKVDTAPDNITEADKPTDIKVDGKVISHYEDEEGNALVTEKEQTGKVGTDYTTSAEVIKGYELTKLPSNQNGVYTVEDIDVVYVYKRSAATIDNPLITKTGTTDITSSTTPVEYKIIYTAVIKNFYGNVTATIIDTLPYEIDESKSTLDGGVYDKNTKTITWTKTFENITPEEVIDVNIEKNVILSYVNIDKTSDSMTNNVKGTLKDDLGNTSPEVKDNQETQINIKGDVITKFVDEKGKEISDSVNQNGKVGDTYQTSPKEIEGYENPVVIKGEEQGSFVEGTLEVIYEYKRVKADITDDTITKKSSVDKITSSNTLIDYEIHYSAVIDHYKGNATYKVVDYLPYEIDEAASTLNDGIYNKNDKTITWIITKENIDTYKDGKEYVNVDKYIVLKYVNVDSKTDIVNRVTGEVITETASSNPKDAEETVESEIKGIVVAEYIYINENGEEIVLDKKTFTDYVGENYKTSALTFNGYKLINDPENKEGKYIEDEITVRYIYDRVEAEITNNSLVKISDDTVITSVNDTFHYTIAYDAVIKEYQGIATVTIIDYLPYEIDETLSDLNGGIYDEITKTILWTISYDVDSYQNQNNIIDIDINISLVYLNIDPTVREVENKVKSTLETETAPTKENEDDAKTELEIKGTVIVKYVDKEGNLISETITMEGLVGEEYETSSKEINGYRLVKIDGNQDGEFIDGEIVVTYVYEKVEQILPPKTGISNNYLPFIISTLFLGIFLLKNKIISEK